MCVCARLLACVCVRMRFAVSQWKGWEGLRLALVSVYLSPSKAISQRGRQGSQLLHCLALHQLTRALPLWIRVEEGLVWAMGKGGESERERERERDHEEKERERERENEQESELE